jgi:arylsulfatase A-like enzyme
MLPASLATMTSIRFCAVLLVCLGAVACGRQEPEQGLGNGVLVIAIDGLRADHLSCFGYDRETTPALDALAAQGTLFESAWSNSPDLPGAHASILTGTDSRLAHRELERTDDRIARLSEWAIPEQLPRMAREFVANRYTTAAFVDHPGLSQAYGFGSGFQEFHSFSPDPRVDTSIGYEGVARRLFAWLQTRAPGENWFAYVHVNDLERLWERGGTEERWDSFFSPREELDMVPPVSSRERAYFAVPRTRWRGAMRTLGEYEALYDGALRRLDTKFGLLFDELRKRGRLRNTTVAVIGTYGTGFGEGGLYLDSGTLSDCDLRVPLLVRPAPMLRCPQGLRAKGVASSMDLAPTLLEICGLSVPQGMSGRSQLRVIRGESESEREFAFASGGLASGYAVMDAAACYEDSAPGASGTALLQRSWSGTDAPSERLQFLHLRATDRRGGHLGRGAQDPALRERLHLAYAEWYSSVELARSVLQGERGLSELNAEERARLMTHRLLPAQ